MDTIASLADQVVHRPGGLVFVPYRINVPETVLQEDPIAAIAEAGKSGERGDSEARWNPPVEHDRQAFGWEECVGGENEGVFTGATAVIERPARNVDGIVCQIVDLNKLVLFGARAAVVVVISDNARHRGVVTKLVDNHRSWKSRGGKNHLATQGDVEDVSRRFKVRSNSNRGFINPIRGSWARNEFDIDVLSRSRDQNDSAEFAVSETKPGRVP